MSYNEKTENLALVLQNLRELFNVKEDTQLLDSIDEQLGEIKAAASNKRTKIEKENTKLKLDVQLSQEKISALAEDLERQRESSQEIASESQIDEYMRELEEIDSAIIGLRKDLQDKVPVLVETNKQLESAEGVLDDQVQLTLEDPIIRANLLKLKLYRSMGVIIDQKNENIIIKAKSGLIDLLPLENDYSDYFVTKHIWDTIQK